MGNSVPMSALQVSKSVGVLKVVISQTAQCFDLTNPWAKPKFQSESHVCFLLLSIRKLGSLTGRSIGILGYILLVSTTETKFFIYLYTDVFFFVDTKQAGPSYGPTKYYHNGIAHSPSPEAISVDTMIGPFA